MRKTLFFMLTAAFVLTAATAAAAETKLPAPGKTGGQPVLEAIDHRSSATQNDFPSKKVGDADLATILWAATGNNRDGRKWTVPMAMGRPPYCKIYVTSTDGAYRYDWKNHSLVEVAKGGGVHAAIPLQSFAQSAPMVMYIVSDSEELGKMNSPFGSEFGLVLAGAMSQNVYLAAEAVDVGARLVYSIRRDEATKGLQLAPDDVPYFAIVLGKK